MNQKSSRNEHPARYADSIKTVVLDALKRQGADIDALLEGYKKRGYSEAQAMDELIADSILQSVPLTVTPILSDNSPE